MHAEYDRDCDEYQAHRVLQAFDTAQFIQLTSGGADLVILAGDLNTEPGDLAYRYKKRNIHHKLVKQKIYRIITNMIGLIDAFMEADTVAQETSNSNTNECIHNSYTKTSLIKNHCAGKRIDYIMYRPGANIKVELKKYALPLPERVPDHTFSYSDHEAVSATLKLDKCEICGPVLDRESQKMILNESIEICDAALRRLIIQKRVYWFFSFILIGLLITTIVTNPPFGYSIIYHILRVVLTGALCFTIIMASLWNRIERNAVLAGKLTMEVSKMKMEQTGRRC